jgi:hypothetical protein
MMLLAHVQRKVGVIQPSGWVRKSNTGKQLRRVVGALSD